MYKQYMYISSNENWKAYIKNMWLYAQIHGDVASYICI